MHLTNGEINGRNKITYVNFNIFPIMIDNNIQKYFYWLLPLIWMAIIFNFSAQPYEKQNIQPYLTDVIDLTLLEPYINWISFTYHKSEVSVAALGNSGVIEFFIRKGAHVFVFGVLCYLFYLALRKTITNKFIYQLIISFVLTFLYAGFDEFHQGFTESRTSYIGDVFLDGFGGALAIILIVIIQLVKKGNKHN